MEDDETSNQSDRGSDHQVELEEDNFNALLVPRPRDFDEWTSLIAETEKTSADDIKKISIVYGNFLSEFPLCYGYWKKLAAHKARLCTISKVIDVYEQAVHSAIYSVDIWVDYCSFGMLLFEDPVDIRRLFERGISYVENDYLCHLLWDKYIEFEYSQKQWSFLAHIYLRTLKFPTRKLHNYYDSFKKLAIIWKEEIDLQSSGVSELPSAALSNNIVGGIATYECLEIVSIIEDLLNSAVLLDRHNALQKYLVTGEEYYLKASQTEAKIHCFESHIRRNYFHVKPLDVGQLENWHQYLDFVELQGDFDRAVKLYERCLIPCASYPDFWTRYINFLESRGGREMAVLALSRATQIYVKNVPAMHRFCAVFKEKIGDICGARVAYQQFGSRLNSEFIENVRREANMEKRLGNCVRAFDIYDKAIEMAKEAQMSNTLSILCVNFSRFKYMVTGNIDAARDVLINGTHLMPQSKVLLEGLINFEMMHRGPKHINILDTFVSNALTTDVDLSQSLTSDDLEDISNLYLEFVDHCGTVHDILKAWNRHRKFFPHSVRISYPPNILNKQVVLHQHIHAPEDNSHESFQNLLLLEREHLSPDDPDTRHSNDAALSVAQFNGYSAVEKQQRLESSQNAEKSGQEVMTKNYFSNKQFRETSEDLEDNANEVSIETYHEPNIKIMPPSVGDPSLDSKGDQNKECVPSISEGCETQDTHLSREQAQNYPINGTSISSSLTHMQSGKSVESSLQKDFQSHSQPLISTNNMFAPSAVARENLHQSLNTGQIPGTTNNNYPQNSQPQQWPMLSQMVMAEGYPLQPQSSSNPQLQSSSQTPNPYQGSAIQVQPVNVQIWPSQNIPQQNFASMLQGHPCPQPIPYNSAQVYPYMMQNTSQYGHIQGNQTYDSQMWQYYYQNQQQIDPSQFQAWSNSYYQQQTLMQQYVTNQPGQVVYNQQVVGSQPQGQGAPQQNVPSTGVVTQAYPQQQPQAN